MLNHRYKNTYVLLYDIHSNFTYRQFHKYFMSSFCANILSPKNYKAKLQVEKNCAKHNCTKKLGVKCWWNWDLGLISSTFDTQILCTKVFFGSFFYLHVAREKLPKRCSFEKKFRIKMLVKLRPGRWISRIRS